MCPRVRAGAFFVERPAFGKALEREWRVERVRLVVR
jgi:hypothetical protein